MTPPARSRQHALRLGILAGLTALTVTACSSGPASKKEVCDSFSALGAESLVGNGFGNPVFHAIKDLAGTAERYTPSARVQADGKLLETIGGSDSTSMNALRNASTNIANLCGHPLGLG